MLVARGKTEIRGARLRHVVCFSPTACIVFVDRTGLVYDTRFVPASEAEDGGAVCLYLLLSGTFEIEGRAPFVAPAVFVMTEVHYEGASGVRPFVYRASGAPYRSIEIHVDKAALCTPTSTEPRAVEVDNAIWKGIDEAASIHETDDEDARNIAVSLVRHFAAAGILREDLVHRVAERSPAFERLWRATRPFVERVYAHPSLQDLSNESGVSIRQLTRDVGAFIGTFNLVKTGWRAVTRRFRLKLAVLFLSADDVTTTEIARLVGYGSLAAMSRAFQDARLPAPHEVQERLRTSFTARSAPRTSS